MLLARFVLAWGKEQDCVYGGSDISACAAVGIGGCCRVDIMQLRFLVLCSAHLGINSFCNYLEEIYYVWGPVPHPGFTTVDTAELPLHTELIRFLSRGRCNNKNKRKENSKFY